MDKHHTHNYKHTAYKPDLFVALRYAAILWLYGNNEVVAPISAPMLQIVPIPG